MFALTVPGEVRALPVISAFIWAVAVDAALSKRQAYRLHLAVDEIVTNIVTHGYGQLEDSPPIALWAEVSPVQVSITIQDSGAPYDITQAAPPPDLTQPPELRDVGGLGVYLVVRFVDELRYEYVNGYNITRVVIRQE